MCVSYPLPQGPTSSLAHRPVSCSDTICNDPFPPLTNIVCFSPIMYRRPLHGFETCLLGRNFHTHIRNVSFSSSTEVHLTLNFFNRFLNLHFCVSNIFMNFNKCLISVGNDHHSNMSKQIEQKEQFEGRDVLKQIKRALASNSLCCYYEKIYLS